MKKCEGFQLTTDHSKLLKNDKDLKNSFIFKHTVDNKVSIELESRRCLLGDGLPRCFNMMMTTGGQITKRQTVKKKGSFFKPIFD